MKETLDDEDLTEEQEQERADRIIGVLNEFEKDYVYEPD